MQAQVTNVAATPTPFNKHPLKPIFTFVELQAAAGGGAVSVSSGAAATLSDVVFVNNSASEQGAGGLQIRFTRQVELARVLFSRNKVRVCKDLAQHLPHIID